jgi:hypothetical protein
LWTPLNLTRHRRTIIDTRGTIIDTVEPLLTLRTLLTLRSRIRENYYGFHFLWKPSGIVGGGGCQYRIGLQSCSTELIRHFPGLQRRSIPQTGSIGDTSIQKKGSIFTDTHLLEHFIVNVCNHANRPNNKLIFITPFCGLFSHCL